MPTKLDRLIEQLDKPPTPNPLESVEYGKSLEEDCKEELSAALRGVKDAAVKEEKRFTDATDSEYWCALVFQTRRQKEAFLRALNLLELGDKYLDGEMVAEKLGVGLPKDEMAYQAEKVDRKMAELTPIRRV